MKKSITSKIDAITKIPEEYLATVLPAPRSVKIELEGRCNYNCSFCARSKGVKQRVRRYGSMDWSLYTRLCKEMREAGVEELGVFYLGEPFLNKDLAKSIYHAKHVAKFPYVFCTTNGSVATYDKVYACAKSGLDSLKFSFNYATEEQFVSIAQVKPQLWYKMLANLEDARKAIDDVYKETGHRCGLYLSYIEFDGEQGDRIKAIVDSYKDIVDEVYALPLYTMGAKCTDDDKGRGFDPTPGNRGRAGALRDPLPCWSAFTEGHITCDGILNVCCFDKPDLVAADLKEVSFMDGWNSDYFQWIRQAHLNKDVSGTPCEKCILVEQD